MNSFTVGGLVGRSFRVWWQNLGVFATVGVIMYLPVMGAAFALGLGRMYTRPFEPDPGLFLRNPGGAALWYLLSIAVMTVHMGALTYGAIQALAARPVRVGEILVAGLRSALPVLLAGILMYLLMGFGFLLLVVPGVILFCALVVTVPTVVVERAGPIAAIKRSFQLTKGRRLAILLAFAVLMLAFSGISLVGNVVLPIVGGALGPGALIAALFASFGVNAIFGSIPTIGPAVAYHDLRAEKEGIGTSDLVKVFE